MVLSNKKLKQKLRTALAESIVRSESSANHSRGETLEKSETSLQSQSLNQILDSSIQKPRLSKREKRRKIRSLNGIGDDAIGGNTGVERNEERSEEPGGHGEEKEEEDKVNRKKRKRRKGKSGGEVNETDAELKEETKKKNKSKKAKKNRKNKSGTTKEKDSNDAMNKDGINASAANGSEVDNSLMSEVDAQKVYVGGIPYYSTEDDIRSYFESCGTIIEVDCMTFPESGRFRGIAFISFKVSHKLVVYC
ncbi:hypothetical protein SAY86_017138 [Trapa natans]|uniref:RRM domain-containing protein n=1 Tax=Trapa natans TaxID=22666 RepID=A0AAN7LQT2_TRANT|nr:hypothetical protein SAY86_017138 [Trapa natans]